jgi:hypothetical protein
VGHLLHRGRDRGRILCVIAGIRLFREQDRPVNVMSAEEMDREESKG